MTLTRRRLALLLAALSFASAVRAQPEAPDALIRRLSAEIIEAIRADPDLRAGDLDKIRALVDAKVMPHVDFRRMTASVAGHHWRRATVQQRERLQEEFEQLLLRTYAGALSLVTDHHHVVVKPMRSRPADDRVVVRTEVHGRGQPVQVDYRLERSDGGWKVHDVNVLGIWFVTQYRSAFAQEIDRDGIQGLIDLLAAKNRSAAAPPSAR